MANTVLVTGANRGIGQEVSRMLAVEGWDVLVGARDRKKGETAAARLRKETGGRLKAVELDVTSEASVATAAQKLRDGAIRIDALVNNAGIYRDADAAVTFATNFLGPLRVADGFAGLLRDGATITNVTSGLGELANLAPAKRALLAAPALDRAGLIGHVNEFLATDGAGWGTDAYGVAKAALNALTRVLAKELAPRGIRVNSTCPGWVRTDMGGRGAPRSIEQGASSVRFGVTAPESGHVYRDGKRIPF